MIEERIKLNNISSGDMGVRDWNGYAVIIYPEIQTEKQAEQLESQILSDYEIVNTLIQVEDSGYLGDEEIEDNAWYGFCHVWKKILERKAV